MPLVRIEFDDTKLTDNEVQTLSEAVQKIVSEVTAIEDVFVYANSAKIKIKIAPIEVFIEMSAYKIDDVDALMEKIKSQLSTWKNDSNFKHPINLTLIPMAWKVEVDI